jgi:excisionase family DNA binding protein
MNHARALNVREVCERLAVAEHTVLSWIRNGELRAINVGRRPGTKKPRWRVTPEALATFVLLRSPAPPAPKRQRRRKHDQTINFY